jgi:hypothetical protein
MSSGAPKAFRTAALIETSSGTKHPTRRSPSEDQRLYRKPVLRSGESEVRLPLRRPACPLSGRSPTSASDPKRTIAEGSLTCFGRSGELVVNLVKGVSCEHIEDAERLGANTARGVECAARNEGGGSRR